MRLGKWQKKALEFAKKYPGWHTYAHWQRITRDPVQRLAKRGIVEVNHYSQFRIVSQEVEK